MTAKARTRKKSTRPAQWKQPGPMPEVSDFKSEDETLIEMLTPIDEETGKAVFRAYWISFNDGGVKGQVFNTHVKDFIDRHAPYPVRAIGEVAP